MSSRSLSFSASSRFISTVSKPLPATLPEEEEELGVNRIVDGKGEEVVVVDDDDDDDALFIIALVVSSSDDDEDEEADDRSFKRPCKKRTDN